MQKRKLDFSLQIEKSVSHSMDKIPFGLFQTCKKNQKIPFTVTFEGATLEGSLLPKSSSNLIELSAVLKGEIELICDLSGEKYFRTLNENLDFLLSDGIVNLNNGHFQDIIECENGIIDLQEILRSELEMIRCDYHIKD